MARKQPAKASPARALALEITAQARKRDAYVRELVNSARADSGLSAQDFDYAQVLIYGVTLCKGTLDEAIDRSLFSPRDVKPNVRDALRIAAFELLFLKKPAHVVVNEGVELVRYVSPRAAGLANAVLRKMVVEAESFPWGDPKEDDSAFARAYGMPLWLASKLIAQYGRGEAAAILEADLEPAPRYMHENPFKPDELFASDLSAQHVAELVPLEGAILEIGAGRGTKTMLLESRAMQELGHTVSIHAVDLHEYKAKLHAQRMQDAGIDDVLSLAGDARDLDAIDGLAPEYEAVFLDAPCSGTGTMRRHPEIRWKLTQQDVDDLASLQHALLAEASTRVKVGGTLVYATCSILDEENQGVVDAFLDGEPEGAWAVGDDSFASVPTMNGPDGHFACVLNRF